MTDSPIFLTFPQTNVAQIVFNRPEVRNALTLMTMQKFAEWVVELKAMPDLRAVILSGAGTQAFCAGGDLSELHALTTADEGAAFSHLMGDALSALEQLPVPVIGALNGYALGGGSEIALACDLRIVDEAVKFGMVHRQLALTPGWGGGQRLLGVVGYARAMELLLSGRILGAEEMLTLGLAMQVARTGEALDAALTFTAQFEAVPLEVVRAIKLLLRAGITLPLEQAHALEAGLFPPLWASQAHLDAVTRFLNRKK